MLLKYVQRKWGFWVGGWGGGGVRSENKFDVETVTSSFDTALLKSLRISEDFFPGHVGRLCRHHDAKIENTVVHR